MSQITLVRHGQANTQARDEDSYDQLSDLGQQQARWLGTHWREAGVRFDRVYTGTLRRHKETCEGIAPDCPLPAQEDARVDEMTYFAMAQLLEQQHGIKVPQVREEFIAHIGVLMAYWEAGRIEGVVESFQAFEARITSALRDIQALGGHTLIVTSGGLISMALRTVLRLDTATFANMCLAVENSSVHELRDVNGTLIMTRFNAVTHLEQHDRAQFRTHL